MALALAPSLGLTLTPGSHIISPSSAVPAHTHTYVNAHRSFKTYKYTRSSKAKDGADDTRTKNNNNSSNNISDNK